jgi:hypothetical protein
MIIAMLNKKMITDVIKIMSTTIAELQIGPHEFVLLTFPRSKALAQFRAV